MNALLRRLRPRPRSTATDPALPVVWQDEGGEDYWAAGHVEPHRMVLAAIAQHLLDVGTEETVEMMFGQDILMARAAWSTGPKHLAGLIAGVEHVWIDADAADKERLVWVTPSHDRAHAVTRMPCW